MAYYDEEELKRLRDLIGIGLDVSQLPYGMIPAEQTQEGVIPPYEGQVGAAISNLMDIPDAPIRGEGIAQIFASGPRGFNQVPVSVQESQQIPRSQSIGRQRPEDYQQEAAYLRDIVSNANADGYGNYDVSGGQLVNKNTGFVEYASPQDIQNFKEYQKAQLNAGLMEDAAAGGYKPSGKVIKVIGPPRTQAEQEAAKPKSSIDLLKAGLDQASARLAEEETTSLNNPNWLNDKQKAELAARRANLDAQYASLNGMQSRNLLKNNPEYQDQLAAAELRNKTIAGQPKPEKTVKQIMEEAAAKVKAEAAAKAASPGTAENERILKRQELAKKGAAATENTLRDAEKMKGFLIDAINRTDWTTAGFVGNLMTKMGDLVGGTDAVDLENILSTIKANIGFNELQEMRKNSPTGGALGQVAVKELDFLQSVEGSLKQNQSPEQLQANLKKILESTKRLSEDLKKNPPNWGDNKPIVLNSEEESDQYPPGTIVIINGRRAVVE